MGLTFFLLTILATLTTLIVYFIGRIVRKKNTTFLSVAKLFFGSAIVAFVVYNVLYFILYRFHKMDLVYILPMLAVALFVVLSIALYATRNKIRNSIAVVLLALIGSRGQVNVIVSNSLLY